MIDHNITQSKKKVILVAIAALAIAAYVLPVEWWTMPMQQAVAGGDGDSNSGNQINQNIEQKNSGCSGTCSNEASNYGTISDNDVDTEEEETDPEDAETEPETEPENRRISSNNSR